MNRRVAINLGFFSIVFVVLVVWAVGNIVTVDAIARPYELSAEFDAAAGVLPNAEVSFLGVRYGRVSDVELIPDGVHMTLKIDRGKHIPQGSKASIFRKSAVGEPYILVTPPLEGASGPVMAPGDGFDRDHTAIPLEFSEMLRSASRLVSAIDPAALGNLVHELSLGLAGRTEDLRNLALAGEKLSGTLAERTAELDRLATNNTRLTKVFADHRASLSGSLADLRAVSASLRRSESDLKLLLDTGPDTLGITANVVADQKANLDCILSDLDDVLKLANTDAHLAGLTTLLDVGPGAFAGVWDTRDVEADGVWIRVGLIVNPANPPQQYVPPKELPQVKAVPVCGSLLVARGGDYTPTPRGPDGLAATGGSAAAGAIFVALAAAVVLVNVGRLERDTVGGR